jgi:hypothetical protein
MQPAATPHPKLSGVDPGREPEGEIRAIVKVAKSGHVPDHVRVRAEVAPTLLSADIPCEHLAAVLDDPCVVSVQVSERLQQINDKPE